MDGSNEIGEHILIFTTNRIDKMDPAFLRPGRIDMTLFMDNATPNIFIEIVTHFLPKTVTESVTDFYNNNKTEIDNLCYYNECKVWSPAKICDICMMYLDNLDYFDKILQNMRDNYNEQVKLLNALDEKNYLLDLEK